VLTRVATDVAMHRAICSLLKSDRGGEGILMVNIDQFEDNRPVFFTPNCRVYHCFAIPEGQWRCFEDSLHALSAKTQIKSASCRLLLDFREYGNPFPDYEAYNSYIRTIGAPYSQTV
jgi:hypothetical protein